MGGSSSKTTSLQCEAFKAWVGTTLPRSTRGGWMAGEGVYRELRRPVEFQGRYEVAVFVDAVHPTHAARPVGCRAPKERKFAIEQTSGRSASTSTAIDLETGQTRMIEAERIDAISTIRLLESLERLYPDGLHPRIPARAGSGPPRRRP